MTNTNVKNYTDAEIFARAYQVTDMKSRRSKGLPLLVGIQSIEDAFDAFDDKFHLFDENNKYVCSASGTTNAGSTGLKDYMKYKLSGTGIWKTNEFYPKCFRHGLHKSRMEALRLDTEIFYYRDSDKDNKAEEGGKLLKGNTAANFHTVSYEKLDGNEKISTRIGAWSLMCQVVNVVKDYRKIVRFVKPYVHCDYILLKEW
jgi:hypothetical protein